MARPLRIEYEGAFYHTTGRGNERRKVFRIESDYNRFREYIRDAQEKYGLILQCYVLMGNHLIVRDHKGQGAIARSVQLIAGRTGQEFKMFLGVKMWI